MEFPDPSRRTLHTHRGIPAHYFSFGWALGRQLDDNAVTETVATGSNVSGFPGAAVAFGSYRSPGDGQHVCVFGQSRPENVLILR